MKVFVLGVPHSPTRRADSICPFTIKAWNQCRLLHRLGHEVVQVGVEGSDAACTENVPAISADEWEMHCVRDGLQTQIRPEQKVAYSQLYASRVHAAIESRCDKPWSAIVCGTWGDAQIAATQNLNQFVVESGIGYRHTWAKYRVFISYAWMHFHYGLEKRFSGDGWYDVVIPNEVDAELFDFKPGSKGTEFLYLGRLNDDKGVALAIDLAKRVGRRIIVVGPGNPDRFVAGHDHVQVLPAVAADARRDLLARAAALICPTRYLEPLGNVALEAQISGTPVICTDWGGFTESVLHGVTGYRCRTMDHFEWAARNIDRIDPAICRQWVVENFTAPRIGKMFEEYYQMLLDLAGEGWYKHRNNRTELDWLTRRYPC